jgi:hypothetical protein
MPKPWSRGTDLRNDKGLYCWPHLVFDAETREFFPSVTTILDLANGDMKFAEFWFIAEYVDYVTQCAYAKELVPCFDSESKEVKERPAREVLQDKHWIKFAGSREMTKRANRGTVVHDAIEDWALNGMRVADDEIEDYTQQLIQFNGYALHVDYCAGFVKKALEWCNEHIVEIVMSEAPVFSREFNYAGTIDLVAKLRGMVNADGSPISEDETWLIDAKNSKAPQPVHPMQSAAYANAETVGIKGTDQMVPFVKPDRFANLYIQEDKATLREWQKEPQAFEAFLHLRMVWQYLIAKDLPVTVKVPKVKTPTSGQMAIPGVV